MNVRLLLLALFLCVIVGLGLTLSRHQPRGQSASSHGKHMAESGTSLATISSQADSDSEAKQRARTLLTELSQFVKQVEAGTINLARDRRKTCQPDAILWELRTLTHTKPEALTALLEFVNSQGESLVARMLAVLAIVHPQSPEATSALAKIISDPSDIRIAAIACASLHQSSERGICRTWSMLLGKLKFVSPKFNLGAAIGGGFEYKPGNADELSSLYLSKGTEKQDKEMLTAVLTLLEKPDKFEMKAGILSAGKVMIDRASASDAERSRFRTVVANSYLSGDSGWETALEILTHPRLGNAQSDIEIVGRGLDRLDSAQLGTVLNEVALASGDTALRPPFRTYIPSVLEYLAKDPSQGGPIAGTTSALLAQMILHPMEAGGFIQEIANHPSALLRYRAASALDAAAIRTEVEARDVFEFCRIMLNDPHSGVSLAAGGTLANLMSKQRRLLAKEQYDAGIMRLREWLKTQSTSGLTGEAAAQIDVIRQLVK
jgi:hypothetical protein